MPHTPTPRGAGRRAGALAVAVSLSALLAACSADGITVPRPTDAPSTSLAKASGDAAAAAAVPSPTDRFAYAVQPYGAPAPSGSWGPVAGYGYSSSGGPITFTHLATGSFRVDFEGLSRAGTTIDNPYGYGAETVVATAAFIGVPGITCNALTWFSWMSVSRLSARVDCTRLDGTLVDAPFSILVVGDGSLPAPSAFAIGDQPTALQYAPDPRWSYTSGPYTLRVGHNSFVGGWDWGMGTGAPAGKIHLVNARTAGDACKIAEYKSLGPSVRCFHGTGQLADMQYQILQVSRGRPGRRFGFAWADQQSNAAPYSPYAGYLYNSSGGAVQVERLNAGYYRVFFQALQSPNPAQSENVQLSSFGGAYSTCSTNGWRPETNATLGNGLAVYVLCSNQYGLPVDSRFNVMVIE